MKIRTGQTQSATITQEFIPRDDKEGDGEGLGGEHVQQRLEALGQLRHGGGQRLPGSGVVHKRSAGLRTADPDAPRGKTDMSNGSTERSGGGEEEANAHRHTQLYFIIAHESKMNLVG